MTVYTLNPSTTNGGRISSFDGSSYTKARAGTGSTISTSTSLDYAAGQRESSNYYVYQTMMDFDTSGVVGTIISVELQIYCVIKYAGVAYTIEARLNDHGTTFEFGDYVAGASLSSKTLLATLASGSITASAYNSFTDVAFPANINTAGKTRFLLSSSRTRLNNTPGSGIWEYSTFQKASAANPPKLIITTSGPVEGVLSKTVGTISLSTGGSLETNGALSNTVGTIALSAAGEGAQAGAGSLNKTIGTVSLSSTVTQETNAYLEATIGTIQLVTAALVPLEGELTASIGLSLSGVIASDTTGALSQTVGTIHLATSNSVGISGDLSATVGTIRLSAVESGPPWPTFHDFPQAPLDGTWRRERGDDTLRSGGEAGARAYRARDGGNYADATFAIMLKSKNALDLLDRFYRDECKNGATPFYWIDPETGDNMAWLWAAPPQIRHVGREAYRVECALLKEAA